MLGNSPCLLTVTTHTYTESFPINACLPPCPTQHTNANATYTYTGMELGEGIMSLDRWHYTVYKLNALEFLCGEGHMLMLQHAMCVYAT